MNSNVGLLIHHYGPDWSISANIEWMAMTFGKDIHEADIMHPTDFPSGALQGWHVLLWVNSQQVYLNKYWMDCRAIWDKHVKIKTDNQTTHV